MQQTDGNWVSSLEIPFADTQKRRGAVNGPYFYSMLQVSKNLKVSKETVSLAVKSGDLKSRKLPGRKRPVITQPDIDDWVSSLEVVNG